METNESTIQTDVSAGQTRASGWFLQVSVVEPGRGINHGPIHYEDSPGWRVLMRQKAALTSMNIFGVVNAWNPRICFVTRS